VEEPMINSRITQPTPPPLGVGDGIKLSIQVDDRLSDKYMHSLRSEFSKQKYQIQKVFGVVDEYK